MLQAGPPFVGTGSGEDGASLSPEPFQGVSLFFVVSPCCCESFGCESYWYLVSPRHLSTRCVHVAGK